jgi:hypothetical protein
VATPPTFVADYEASTWLNNTSPKTVTPTTAAGDILAVVGAGSNNVTTLATPTGNSLVYTLAQSIVVANFCATYGWTAPDPAGGAGWTLSDSETGSGTAFWGFTALRFSGSDGVGASAKTNAAGGAPSLAITTLQDNSAIVVIVADFAAVDGATRTWRTVNGITPTLANGLETTYTRDAAEYTVYVAYYSDAGAVGSNTVGLTVPSIQDYSIIAIEIKGAAGAPPPQESIRNSNAMDLMGF